MVSKTSFTFTPQMNGLVISGNKKKLDEQCTHVTALRTVRENKKDEMIGKDMEDVFAIKEKTVSVKLTVDPNGVIRVVNPDDPQLSLRVSDDLPPSGLMAVYQLLSQTPELPQRAAALVRKTQEDIKEKNQYELS